MKRVGVFLIVVALIAVMAGCGGTPSGVGIRDWYDLDAIRENLGGSYLLMNDLDSTVAGYEGVASPTANQGDGWEPIGTESYPFTGTFHGQGCEIRDLFIDRPNEDYVGLFGYAGEGGTIEDIGAANVNVTGYHYVGGLTGCNNGTVTDSYSIGSVTGEKYFGGLVGYDSGNTVSNSYYNHDESLINGENMITTGALSDEDFEEWLANSKFLDVSERLSQEDGYYLIENVSDFKELLAFGQNATLKFRLTNDLDLGNDPNFFIPYLAGEFDGNGHIISNLSLNHSAYSALGLFGYLVLGGDITELGVENINIIGYSDIGGLVGYNCGTVSNSYVTGSVTGHDVVGGLVGDNWGTVSNSYSTGSVTGDGHCIGGLAGDNAPDGIVNNCYSTSSVTGYGHVGGLVGQHLGTVSNSYAIGSVIGNLHVGGLVGANVEGTVTDSFWDTETSGQATSDGGIGKTTAEMQDISTFSAWDIIAVANPGLRNSSYIWNIVDDVTYPFLSWQPVS